MVSAYMLSAVMLCFILSVSMPCLMLIGLWSVIYGKYIYAECRYTVPNAKCQYALSYAEWFIVSVVILCFRLCQYKVS
jgi:hypothetical protein